MQADFVLGGAPVPFSTRSTDGTPFNAGGFMRGNNGPNCTSGFGIKRGAYTWVTTARHCNAASYTAFDRPGSSYGRSQRVGPETGTRMLTGSGFYRMFDGAWNNSSGYYKNVAGLSNVSEGSSVCSSGGNSGVHCGLIVQGGLTIHNDGYGRFYTLRAIARSGIAAATGDSGGPIFIPASDGRRVWAVGMVQAGTLGSGMDCPSLHVSSAAICTRDVLFSTTRDMLREFAATLVPS
jgi:hypothetical protein